MKPLQYWPLAVLTGISAFSFYLLGPLISGLLLLFLTVIATAAITARLIPLR